MVLVRGPGRGVKGSLRLPGPPNAIKRALLGVSIWPVAHGVLISLRCKKKAALLAEQPDGAWWRG